MQKVRTVKLIALQVRKSTRLVDQHLVNLFLFLRVTEISNACIHWARIIQLNEIPFEIGSCLLFFQLKRILWHS